MYVFWTSIIYMCLINTVRRDCIFSGS